MKVNKDFGRVSTPANRTVTLAERLQIMRELNREPRPQQHLVPKGVVRIGSDAQTKTLLKRRLEHVDRRLMVADVNMNYNQGKAFNKHKAKSGFNREAGSHER